MMTTCKVCDQPFVSPRPMAQVCSPRCAIKLPQMARTAMKRAAIADRKKTKARLDDMRPLGYWMKQAQHAFNAWIRARDAHLPCISCGRKHEGAYDAGHYLTVGARPELRFDEQNVHRQCVPCNQHLHGNLILYRVGLIARIGQAAVDRLEGPHPPRQLRRPDLIAIRDDYRARLKAMQT